MPSDPKILNALIGKRIREMRGKYGISQKKLSKELKEHYKIRCSYFSRIENGKAPITLRTLDALSDFFKVPPDHFLKPDNDDDTKNMLGVYDEELLADIKDMQNKMSPEKFLHVMKHSLSIYIEMYKLGYEQGVLHGKKPRFGQLLKHNSPPQKPDPPDLDDPPVLDAPPD